MVTQMLKMMSPSCLAMRLECPDADSWMNGQWGARQNALFYLGVSEVSRFIFLFASVAMSPEAGLFTCAVMCECVCIQ